MKKPGTELAFGFGGLWTEFKGDSGTKSKPIPGPHLIYGFLTTAPHAMTNGLIGQLAPRRAKLYPLVSASGRLSIGPSASRPPNP